MKGDPHEARADLSNALQVVHFQYDLFKVEKGVISSNSVLWHLHR